MKKMTRNLGTLLLAAGLLFALPTLTAAESYSAFVDGPVVVGDQLFSGGVVVLEELASPQILAVNIDGARVAMIYRQDFERHADNSRAQIVFQRDERGFFHLASYDGSRQAQPLPVRVAVVSQGLSSVPDYRPLPVAPARALAAR